MSATDLSALGAPPAPDIPTKVENTSSAYKGGDPTNSWRAEDLTCLCCRMIKLTMPMATHSDRVILAGERFAETLALAAKARRQAVLMSLHPRLVGITLKVEDLEAERAVTSASPCC